MKAHAQPVVGWILRAMVGLAFAAATVGALVAGPAFGLWVLVGGFGCVGLTWLFAFRAFRADARRDPRAALGAMVRAEALKLSVATLAFVALAMFAPERFGAVMVGFAAGLTGYWFALPVVARRMEREAGDRRPRTRTDLE